MSNREIVGIVDYSSLLSFVRKDVGCGDSVRSVYADCVDYEVRRREIYRLGIGELGMCIVYYCI